LLACSLFGAKEAELARQFETTVKPFVAKHCAGCHSGAKPAAELDLKKYGDLKAVVE
jgi:hypothetical protein